MPMTFAQQKSPTSPTWGGDPARVRSSILSRQSSPSVNIAASRSAKPNFDAKAETWPTKTPSWNFSGVPAFAADRGLRTTSSPRPTGLTSAPVIHAKLAVGSVDDPLEREADEVADKVMRTAATPTPGSAAATSPQRCAACAAKHADVGSQPAAVDGSTIRRSVGKGNSFGGRCEACEQEESAGLVRRRAQTGSTGGATAPDSVRSVLGASGKALTSSVQGFFESRFGESLGHVRVHDDAAAAKSAAEIGALAYSCGAHIVFGAGRFRPGQSDGDRLIAHEIAHTLQDRRGGAAPVRRQSHGGGAGGGHCEAEVVFAPIRMAHLDAVGSVHAIINVSLPGGGWTHAEVQPEQHQGPADPGSGSVGGRSLGIHSHVVLAGGRRGGSSSNPLTVTCDQARAIQTAARRYESLDVTYNAPPGPNSNSFAEWVLAEAGVPSSGVSVPFGAWGWSYYQSNPQERAVPPRIARRASQTAATCTMPHPKAATFAALIALVRRAETQLIACGVTDVGERVHVIRGIYYGTPWSRDYDTSESSHVRNAMFNVYTGGAQPRNPLECLDCGTFLSLNASQDVTESAGSHGSAGLDFGHLMIGLDARRSVAARTVPQPVGQVTGLEASTWAGDLGGGAARLAVDRVGSATAPALRYFTGNDYGASSNLEGDVGAYAAASGPGLGAPALSIPPGSTLADALETYMIGHSATHAPAGRNTRAAAFLRAMGGSLDAGGALTNRAVVVGTIAAGNENFGCWYLVNYMRQHGGLDLARAEEASHHLVGTAHEIAELFVTALERSSTGRSPTIAVTGPAPTPSPRAANGTCTTAILAARAAAAGGRAVDRAREEFEGFTRRLGL